MTGTWSRGLIWLGGIYLLISALVLGGLGWATFAALELERDQRRVAVQVEHAEQVRLALWRLDTRFAPTLAREESRPFDHYVALHPPVGALRNDGQWWSAGMVWLPSPLLNAELPDWMRLHFQVDAQNGWRSPQVIVPQLRQILASEPNEIHLENADPIRVSVLEELSRDWPPPRFFAQLGPIRLDDTPSEAVPTPRGPASHWPPSQQQSRQDPNFPDLSRDFDTRNRIQQRSLAEGKGSMQNTSNYLSQVVDGKTSNLFGSAPKTVEVHIGPMTPWWLCREECEPTLVLVRAVRVDRTPAYQGLLLDWHRLREVLRDEIADLFPNASLHPAGLEATPSDRLMSALPVRLDAGTPPEPRDPGWTTLRIGLGIAWLAAVIALSAVGLAGAGLISLSERRMRFASAVTHELRTPLTTLRLYLDMLASGMVRDDRLRQEYLVTLNVEADRLHRLIGNVLDFSRLEKVRRVASLESIPVDGLMQTIGEEWRGRCKAVGKELILENGLEPDAKVWAEPTLLGQVLGCLIDNAQKHTRGCSDARIWLRAVRLSGRTLALEVEDRGVGLTGSKRRLFRPFSQGPNTTGGVGLGLALAKRWAKMLGGRISVRTPPGGIGTCFRIELRSAPR